MDMLEIGKDYTVGALLTLYRCLSFHGIWTYTT